jgi:hypothetical protein
MIGQMMIWSRSAVAANVFQLTEGGELTEYSNLKEKIYE